MLSSNANQCGTPGGLRKERFINKIVWISLKCHVNSERVIDKSWEICEFDRF